LFRDRSVAGGAGRFPAVHGPAYTVARRRVNQNEPLWRIKSIGGCAPDPLPVIPEFAVPRAWSLSLSKGVGRSNGREDEGAKSFFLPTLSFPFDRLRDQGEGWSLPRT